MSTSSPSYKIFRGDLAYALAPHLDFKSFINFCRIFKPTKNLQLIFDRCMANRVNNYLKKLLGSHFEQWRTLMIADRIVLSGSTIIQVLLDEYWDGSDLDFFNPLLGNKIRGVTGYFCRSEDFLYAKFQWYPQPNPDDACVQYVFNADKKISRVHSYDLNGKKFQIISIAVEADYAAVHDFIEESFDLDVLMNSFYYEFDEDQQKVVPRLRLHSVDHLLNKVAIATETKPIHLHRARIKKYQARGFTVKRENSFQLGTFITIN